MSALGAKYCFFNKVRPVAFARVVREYLPRGETSRIDLTVDVPGFRLKEFAHLIDEQTGVVQSQSPRDLIPGPLLSGVARVGGPSFESFKSCPECLACGYHSVLHQLPWIERCFIHDSPLVSGEMRPVSLGKGLPNDMRFVAGLFDLWFGEKSPWPEARTPNWKVLASQSERRRVTEIHNAFRYMEDALADLKNGPRHAFRILARPQGDRLLLVARVLGCEEAKWEKYAGSKHNWPHKALIRCTERQAEVLLAHDEYWLGQIQDARFHECATDLEKPRWVIELNELIRRMSAHHYECEKKMEELSIRWPMEWFDQGHRRGAIALYADGVDVCRRLPFLALLEHATSQSRHNSEYLSVSEILHYQDNVPDTCSYVTPGAGGMPVASPAAAIADELLLAWVWAVGWVLYRLEREQYRPQTDQQQVIEDFEGRVKAALPSISVQTHKRGLELIVYQRTPRRLPSWAHLDRSLVKHRRHFARMTSGIEQILDEQQQEHKRRLHEMVSRLFS